MDPLAARFLLREELRASQDGKKMRVLGRLARAVIRCRHNGSASGPIIATLDVALAGVRRAFGANAARTCSPETFYSPVGERGRR